MSSDMATITADRFPPILSDAARSTSSLFTDLANSLLSYQLSYTTTSKDNAFNAKKHIAFTPPSKIFTMSDLGLPGSPLSSIAVSEPFRLFSLEAVERIREEIFQPQMAHYQVSSNLAAAQLRGYAKKEAPFIYQAWKSPEVLAIVSKIAGVDLVPCMDLEIGHINLSSTTISDSPTNEEEGKPIVDWHTDAYPFVVVTMLSDCTNMVGGETVLRKGDGNTMKVRSPQMGYSILLQGRYIEHKALRAFGSPERITSVTSFRPKDHRLPDDTVLTTVRPISDLDQLYGQYAEYRIEILKKRLEDQIREMKEAGGGVDVGKLKGFLKESVWFLVQMDRQIVEKEKVKFGSIDNSHLLAVGGKTALT